MKGYKIFIDKDKKSMVKTNLGSMRLVELCEILRKRTDMKIQHLEWATGIGSRAYFVMTKGKNDGLKTLIRVLDTLGYDVIIQKRDPEGE